MAVLYTISMMVILVVALRLISATQLVVRVKEARENSDMPGLALAARVRPSTGPPPDH
jgi:hypothetical protein